MMFKYMYDETGDERFAETSNYWADATLTLATNEDGPAGYKRYTLETTPPWKDSYTMLEGIAGIGLVIIRGLVALRIVGNREFAVILIVLHTISSRFMLPDMRGAGARPSYVENTKTARNRNGSGLNFTVYSRACIIRLTIAPANRLT